MGEGRLGTIAGEDGSYGTSIERYKALDPASDIILAFKQNGRLLTPDHGYPLRIIIPGSLPAAQQHVSLLFRQGRSFKLLQASASLFLHELMIALSSSGTHALRKQRQPLLACCQCCGLQGLGRRRATAPVQGHWQSCRVHRRADGEVAGGDHRDRGRERQLLPLPRQPRASVPRHRAASQDRRCGTRRNLVSTQRLPACRHERARNFIWKALRLIPCEV